MSSHGGDAEKYWARFREKSTYTDAISREISKIFMIFKILGGHNISFAKTQFPIRKSRSAQTLNALTKYGNPQ